MNILDALKQLRDDTKTWVTNNLNALNAKIDEKTIPIDSELSSTSTNPVQNKIITNAINNIPRFSGDYNDLTNAPNITEDESGEVNVADSNGNVIFKIDSDGTHTTSLSLNGEDVGSELDKLNNKINNINTFSGDYNDLTNAPNILEDESGNMVIADESGNIIFKADADGIHTTAVSLNGEVAASEKYVDEAIANIDIPEVDFTGCATEDFVNTAIDSAKEELSESIVAESNEWKVVDEAGNIIFSVNESGAHTTSLTVNGETTASEKYVDDAIANIDIPETDLTGYATETYVDNKVADLVNSAPEALNTLGELAVALENHEDAYYALLEIVSNKATQDDLENLKEELSKSITAEAEDWKVVDSNGNIIFSVDNAGAHTTNLTLNEEKVATEEYVNTQIANIPTSGGSGANAIIDVTSLPTENINKNSWYRLMTAYFVVNKEDCTGYNFICYCVDNLPEAGIPATNSDMNIINAYYSIQDNAVYGYIDDMLSYGLNVPVGWYDLSTLLSVAGESFAGVITDIDDDPEDSVMRLLLKYDFYMYQDGWCKVPFAYEKAPKIDITWDGDMTNHSALDMSALGYPNTYFVKVNDDVFTIDEVIGWNYQCNYYDGNINEYVVTSDSIDTITYPGAFVINNYIVIVYDEAELGAALGIPIGTYTNGVYFWLGTEIGYISRLVSQSRITKIDSKFLNVDISALDNFATVATTGNYNDLINKPNLHTVATTGNYNNLSNKPTIYTDVIRYNASQSLNSTAKATARTNIDVYSKNEVTDLIAEAIGGAIGGSY